jgi:hypothetical protein
MDIQQRIDSHSAPLLDRLAVGCHNGACNVKALINDLAKGMSEEFPYAGDRMKEDPRIKYIVAHIAFLLGQAAGPDDDTFQVIKKMAEEATATVTQECNPIVDIQKINQVIHFVNLYNREQISTRGCLDQVKSIVSN